MKHLSFDVPALERGHELRNFLLDREVVGTRNYHRDPALLEEMRRREMPVREALKKEVPLSVAHSSIHLIEDRLLGLGEFDPADPELSDYEAARIATVAVGSKHNYEVGHARHLAAHRSGEYDALLEASEVLPQPYRGFVRAEVQHTMAEKEHSAYNSSKRDGHYKVLGLDINALRRGAIAGYQEAMEGGLPYVMPKIVSEHLGLLDQGEHVVDEFVGLIQRMVREQLSPDKSTPIGMMEALFNRDVYVVEGFKLMEWLIENGVPQAARSFVNGFWGEVQVSFKDPRMDAMACHREAQRLIARAMSLEPSALEMGVKRQWPKN